MNFQPISTVFIRLKFHRLHENFIELQFSKPNTIHIGNSHLFFAFAVNTWAKNSHLFHWFFRTEFLWLSRRKVSTFAIKEFRKIPTENYSTHRISAFVLIKNLRSNSFCMELVLRDYGERDTVTSNSKNWFFNSKQFLRRQSTTATEKNNNQVNEMRNNDGREKNLNIKPGKIKTQIG